MDESSLPAPGWYPDPDMSTRLRYWDGRAWTDHYHTAGTADGGLPPIGDWMSSTLSAIGSYGIPALGFAIGANVVTSALGLAGAWWSMGSLAMSDQELVGADSVLILRAIVVVVVVALLSVVNGLALYRFMHRAHQQAEPSILESVRHAITKLPRALGVFLVVLLLALIGVLAFAAIIGVASMVPAGLGAIAILLALGIGFGVAGWGLVKSAFLVAAIVAAPSDTSAIRASMSVSHGRFWPVCGRVLVLVVLLLIFGGVFGGALSGVSQSGSVDLADRVVVTETEVFVRDFEFRDVLPAGFGLVGYLFVSSLINGFSSLVSTSGFMRLYLDSGAPAEV